MTSNVSRTAVISGVVSLTLFALAGCTGASSSPATGAAEAIDSATVSGAPAEADVTLLSTREAADQFLTIVCPADTALHLVETVYLTEGDWAVIKPKDIRPYTRNAVEAARKTSQELLREDWPTEVAEVIPEVSREYLEIVTRLDQIDQANSGSAMRRPWNQVQSLSRTAEQQVRVALGLSTLGSKNDGCPPAPKVPERGQASQATPRPTTPAAPMDYRTRLCTTSAGNLPSVTRGQSSDGVKLLQWSLTQLGYYRGAIGGNYGERTFDATFRFQLDNGLGRTAPGSVSVNTWSWLKYYLC